MRCEALLRSTNSLIGADFDSDGLPAKAVQGARHNKATAGNRRVIGTSKGSPATTTSQPFAAARAEKLRVASWQTFSVSQVARSESVRDAAARSRGFPAFQPAFRRLRLSESSRFLRAPRRIARAVRMRSGPRQLAVLNNQVLFANGPALEVTFQNFAGACGVSGL